MRFPPIPAKIEIRYSFHYADGRAEEWGGTWRWFIGIGPYNRWLITRVHRIVPFKVLSGCESSRKLVSPFLVDHFRNSYPPAELRLIAHTHRNGSALEFPGIFGDHIKK